MTTNNISELLNNPFEYYEYGVNYEGNVYIGQQSVVDRLNQVLGFENWEHKPLETKISMETFSVSILGELKVYSSESDRWITRTQYGNDTMTIKQNDTEPKAQAIEDAKKSAMSDCLKKCASWFGVASDVYKNRLKSIRSKHDGKDSRIYLTLIRKFNLNHFEHKNGLVILPNSYKEYYKEQGWNGIFESDLEEILQSGESQHQERNSQNSSYQHNTRNGNNQNNGKRNQKGNSNSSGGSTQPQSFRIKVFTTPNEHQDGTAIFDALLESKNRCVVIVPKEYAKQALQLAVPNAILNVKGWLKDGNLTLAKNGKIVVDRKRQQAS